MLIGDVRGLGGGGGWVNVIKITLIKRANMNTIAAKTIGIPADAKTRQNFFGFAIFSRKF